MSQILFAAVIAFLLGSIPTGLLVARRLSDVDIRQMGSGNIGATNIYRSFGWKWGALVFGSDALKGTIAVLIARSMFISSWGVAIAAMAVAAGHVFNPWLRFKGGKGVATAFGAMLGATPLTALCALGLWGIVLWRTRIVSLASLAAAAGLPVLALIFNLGTLAAAAYPAGALAISGIVVYAHRENIQRLRSGQEKKIEKRK